jgi:hypothetical protein
MSGEALGARGRSLLNPMALVLMIFLYNRRREFGCDNSENCASGNRGA